MGVRIYLGFIPELGEKSFHPLLFPALRRMRCQCGAQRKAERGALLVQLLEHFVRDKKAPLKFLSLVQW